MIRFTILTQAEWCRKGSSAVRYWSPVSCLDTGGGCARDLVRLMVARLGSCKPFVSEQQVVLVLALICESDAMESEKKLGSGRILSPRSRQQLHGQLGEGARLHLGAGPKQPRADATLFLPRFLLREIIFAHCPYVLYFLQPRLRGNLLCRTDWLFL